MIPQQVMSQFSLQKNYLDIWFTCCEFTPLLHFEPTWYNQSPREILLQASSSISLFPLNLKMSKFDTILPSFVWKILRKKPISDFLFYRKISLILICLWCVHQAFELSQFSRDLKYLVQTSAIFIVARHWTRFCMYTLSFI